MKNKRAAPILGMILMAFSPYTKPNKSGVSRIVRDTYGPDWFDLGKQVRIRDKNRCIFCSKVEKPKEKIYHEVHHVRSLKRGGTTTLSNLCLCCKDCHDKRPGHSHLKAQRAGGDGSTGSIFRTPGLAKPARPANPNFRGNGSTRKTPVIRYGGKP